MNGGIAGCAILDTDGSNAHLVNIAVDPGFRGHGPRQNPDVLLRNTAPRQTGATAMDLATHIGIPENVALYRHLGWSETSRNGNKVFMTKKL